MKKLFTLIMVIFLTLSSFAQSPEKMSYQCVVRNASGVLVTNQGVGVRISVLQGTASGTLIYQEIYNPNPQTNANGLVTIEIGGGTPITGTFSAINWASGPYFLRTETDPTGGTNYTIVGTSQLLSVPYAQYAKTADNVTGTVAIANGGTGATTVPSAKTSLGLGNVDNTTDLLKPISTATQTALALKAPIASPTFTGTVSGITKSMVGLGSVDNTTDLLKPVSTATQTALNLKAPIASPTFTGTPLATTAAAGTNTTQIATTAFVTSALNASVPAHYIGESYGGGIVFYVYDNGRHGLIAATADQSTGVVWTDIIFTSVSNAVRDGINGGLANTERIIIQAGAGSYAAQQCANYKGGNYGDWYLPSRFELNLLYLQKTVVGGFASDAYWSSTEYDSSHAWGQFFLGVGAQANFNKDNTPCVRAVRAF